MLLKFSNACTHFNRRPVMTTEQIADVLSTLPNSVSSFTKQPQPPSFSITPPVAIPVVIRKAQVLSLSLVPTPTVFQTSIIALSLPPVNTYSATASLGSRHPQRPLSPGLLTLSVHGWAWIEQSLSFPPSECANQCVNVPRARARAYKLVTTCWHHSSARRVCVGFAALFRHPRSAFSPARCKSVHSMHPCTERFLECVVGDRPGCRPFMPVIGD